MPGDLEDLPEGSLSSIPFSAKPIHRLSHTWADQKPDGANIPSTPRNALEAVYDLEWRVDVKTTHLPGPALLKPSTGKPA